MIQAFGEEGDYEKEQNTFAPDDCTYGVRGNNRILAGLIDVRNESTLPGANSGEVLLTEGISLHELRVKLVERELQVSALQDETKRSMEGRPSNQDFCLKLDPSLLLVILCKSSL